MQIRRSKGVRTLTMTAAAAAAMGVIAPWSVPLGPIPVSLCTMLIYLMAYLMGGKQALTAVLVYVLMGAAGLPVFSGFTGGFGVLAGPTGGFVLGYLPMSALCALAVKKANKPRAVQLGGMLGATAVLYLFGTAWYCVQAQVGVWAGVAVCVLPFLPGDGVKILAALIVGPALNDRMVRAGLLER